MAETELERAEKRYAQAKARLQALKNREAARERKLDTRRKVILGGALIDLAARDSHAAAMLDRLIRNLPRDQDRRTFDGWDAKTAAPAPHVAPASAAPDTETGTAVDGIDPDMAAARAPFDVGELNEEDRRLREELRKQAPGMASWRGPGGRR